jgi:type I restriction enzyme S subunit
VEINPKPDRGLLSDDLDVSFVPMAMVEAGTGNIDATIVRKYAEVKKGYTHFRDDDVLFAKITPCMENGKMAVAKHLHNGIGFGSTEFHVLRSREGVDPHYVYHFVAGSRFRAEAAHYMTGAVGQKRVPTSFLERAQIPLPPIQDQRRIVAEIEKQFSRLDEAVANLKRVKANLKRYKAAVLKAAVEGCLVPTEAELARRDGRSYETGAQLLKRILETRRSKWKGKGKYKEPVAPDTTDLPELPEGWVWMRLDAIAALKGGITVDSKRKDLTARSVPYLRVANVQRGYLDLAEVKHIDAPATDIEELRLQPGDILFNEGGDRDKLGRGWIWEGQLADCIHQNHVFRGRLFFSEVSSKLLSWWGNSFGKDYFSREGKQTTNLASINLTKLSAFPVPLAPLAEQNRIAAEGDRRLSFVREVETEVEANLKRAEGLRQSILQTSFAAGALAAQ